jgi:hypothetical protein
MRLLGQRAFFLLVAAVYGLALGLAIVAALLLLARLWSPAPFVVGAAVVIFELWRLRGGRKAAARRTSREISARPRVPTPIVLFVAIIIGGLIAFAVAALRGAADSTSIALLVGIVIGAGVPAFVDMSHLRRGA